MPDVNDIAPDFTLPDIRKNAVTLSSLRGQKVLLAFYPGAFTGVCDKEMCTFRDAMAEYNELNATVVGISVDGPWANAGFARMHQLEFTLLSDYNRTVVRGWGHAIDNFAGLEGYTASNRAVYILDEEGRIVFKWVGENPGKEPDYEELKAVLAG